MTEQELEDKYFHDFLVWCTKPPEDRKSSTLIFWLDHNQPTVDNFWEWVVFAELLIAEK